MEKPSLGRPNKGVSQHNEHIFGYCETFSGKERFCLAGDTIKKYFELNLIIIAPL